MEYGICFGRLKRAESWGVARMSSSMDQQKAVASRYWLLQHSKPIDWVARLQGKAAGKVHLIERLHADGVYYARIRMRSAHRLPSIQKRIAGPGVTVRLYHEHDPQAILMREKASQIQTHHFDEWRKRARHRPSVVDKEEVQCGTGKRWLFTYCTPHSPITCGSEMPAALQSEVDRIRCTSQPPMNYLYVEFASNIHSNDLLSQMITIDGLRPSAISCYRLLEKIKCESKSTHPAMRVLLQHQVERNIMFREWTRTSTAIDVPETDWVECLHEAVLLIARLKQLTSSRAGSHVVKQRIDKVRRATESLRASCSSGFSAAEIGRVLTTAQSALANYKNGAFDAAPDEPFAPTTEKTYRGAHWLVAYDWTSNPIDASMFGSKRVVHIWNTMSIDSLGSKVRYAYVKFHKRTYDGPIRDMLVDLEVKCVIPATAADTPCLRTLLNHQLLAHDHFETWHEDGRSGPTLPSFLMSCAPDEYGQLAAQRRRLVTDLPKLRDKLAVACVSIIEALPDVNAEQGYRKTLWSCVSKAEVLLRAVPPFQS